MKKDRENTNVGCQLYILIVIYAEWYDIKKNRFLIKVFIYPECLILVSVVIR